MMKFCLLILVFYFISCGLTDEDQPSQPEETTKSTTAPSKATTTPKAPTTQDPAQTPPPKTKRSAYIYNKTDHTLRVIISKQHKDSIVLIDIGKCLNLTPLNEISNPIVEIEIQALYSDGDVDQVCSVCDISQTTLTVDETYYSWVTPWNFGAKPVQSIPPPCVLQDQQKNQENDKAQKTPAQQT